MGIIYQSAVIFVQDISVSKTFYVELLEQEIDMDFGLNVGLNGGLALWQVDHAFQMIFSHPPKEENSLGHQNFELYFKTPDLEYASRKLSEAGVQFVHPLREQPWGQKALRVVDPDGHILELAEPMQGVIFRLLE
jgi:predicted enzyme related to lactoylglutathione lyase